MDVEALRERTRLTPSAFGDLLGWLQREYLVDVVTHLEGDRVVEKVELTEKGEAALVSMLEKTCELPEFR
jgi:DNA-binding MarR family transcriptional regulator